MNTVIELLLMRSIRYRERRFIAAAKTIAATRFPSGVLFSAKAKLPEGMIDDAVMGLKNYLLAHAHVQFAPRTLKRVHLAMPSAGVEALWHAFLLDTRAYAAFCEKAFGRLLHHAPAAQSVRDERYDWRARYLKAQAQTLAHVTASRSDLATLAPHTLKSFGDLSALFVATAFVTNEFPYCFGMEELHESLAPAVRGAWNARTSSGAGCGGSTSPTCFGHCGDGGRGSISTSWGQSDGPRESSGWGGGGDGGGDGGGGDGGGGCGGCGS